MTTLDNPAGRLLAILEEAEKIGKKNTKQKCREVWAQVLKVEVTETEKLFTGYLAIMNLTSLAKRSLEELDDVDPELHLSPFNRLQQGFSTVGFNHQWEQFNKFLDPATITGMKHCSHILSTTVGEKIITQQVLDELKEEIEQLQKRVMQANLSEELRALLFEKLEEMYKAVIDYNVNGANGMKQALESTIGGLWLAYEPVKNEVKEGNSVVEEVLAFVDKYKNTVANAVVKQITSSTIGFVISAIAQIQS